MLYTDFWSVIEHRRWSYMKMWWTKKSWVTKPSSISNKIYVKKRFHAKDMDKTARKGPCIKMCSKQFFKAHLCIENQLFWKNISPRKALKSCYLSPPTNFVSFGDFLQKLCLLLKWRLTSCFNSKFTYPTCIVEYNSIPRV